ncbi:AAA family ATPase [Neobacillus sp. K501]
MKTKHPQINAVLKRFEDENTPFVKVHRLIDLFETIIKTHAAYIIAEYLKRNIFTDRIKALLAHGLITPSLGMWQFISREIMKELVISPVLTIEEMEEFKKSLDNNQAKTLEIYYDFDGTKYALRNELRSKQVTKLRSYFKQNKHQFCTPFLVDDYIELFDIFDDLISKKQEDEEKTELMDIVAFRNYYAHGATAAPEKCEKHIKQYTPLLHRLLDHPLFQQYEIVVVDELGQYISLENIERTTEGRNLSPYYVYLQGQKDEINLSPIMFYKQIKQSAVQYFFLNDLKKYNQQQISLLEYPHAYHLTDDSSFKEFNEKIRINEWKMAENEDFKALIQQLSEYFYGRIDEIQQLKKFITNESKGYAFVYGHPGIGKSALMAKLLNEIRFEQDQKDKRDVVTIEYFVRRNTIFADPSYFFDTLLEKLALAFPFVEIRPAGSLSEKKKCLHKTLQQISLNLNKQKLVILVDGLDEGRETGLLEHLMTQAYDHVLIIYTGRPDDDVLQKERGLECKQDPVVLEKLSSNEIRALLYNVTDKYQIFGKDEYFENLILKKSDGNPLYVRLLCEAFETSSVTLETIEQIPEKLDGLYKKMLKRFAAFDDVDEVFDLLALIVAAKDYVDGSLITAIFNISPLKAQKLFHKVGEVLLEEMEGNGRYQIFHESFRDFFNSHYPREVEGAVTKLLALSGRWENLSDGALSYVLEHTATHLFEKVEKETMQAVVKDRSFIRKQIEQTNRFDASVQLCQLAQMLAKKTGYASLSIDAFQAYKFVQLQILKNKFISSNSLNKFSLEVWLDRIKHFTDFEKCITYLFLLDHYGKEDNEEVIFTVLNHLEQNNHHLKLNTQIPTIIALQICHTLKARKMDITPVFKHISWNSEENLLEYYDFSFEVELIIVDLFNCNGINFSSSEKIFNRLLELGFKDRAKTFINQFKAHVQFVPCYIKLGEYDQAASLIEQSKSIYHKLNYLVNMKKIDQEMVEEQVRKLNIKQIKQVFHGDLIESKDIIPLIYQLNYDLFKELLGQYKNLFIESKFILTEIEHGDFERTLELIASPSTKFDKKIEYLSYIYGKAKDEKQVKRIRQIAIQTIKNLKTIFNNDSEIARILRVCSDEGDEELIKLILSKDIEYYALTTLCMALAEGYAKSGNTQALLQLIKQYEEQIPIYTSVVQHLFKTDQVQLALEIACKGKRLYIREEIYKIIAIESIKNGNKTAFHQAYLRIQLQDNKEMVLLEKFADQAGHNQSVMEEMIEELSTVAELFTNAENDEILLQVKDVDFYNGKMDFNFEWIHEINFGLQGNAYRQIIMRLLEKKQFDPAIQLVLRMDPREFLPYSNDFFEELMILILRCAAQSGEPEVDNMIKNHFLSQDYHISIDVMVENSLIFASFCRENHLLQQEKNILIAIEKKITQKQRKDQYLELALYYKKIGNESDAKRLHRKCLEGFKYWQDIRLIFATQQIQMESSLKKRWKDADCSKSISELYEEIPEEYKKDFYWNSIRHYEKEQTPERIEQIASQVPDRNHPSNLMKMVEFYYIEGNVEKVKMFLQPPFSTHTKRELLKFFIKQATSSDHWRMMSFFEPEVIKDVDIWRNQLTLLSPQFYEIALDALPSMPIYMQEVVVEALMFHIFKTPHLIERLMLEMPIHRVLTLQILQILQETELMPESKILDFTPLYEALDKLKAGEWRLHEFKQFVNGFEI